MARILIVDDNAEMRRLLTAILVDEGHRVVVAADGQQALDMIVSTTPDLILLDVMMPVKDGFMVLRDLRELAVRQSVRVLMLTARTSEHDWVEGFRLGADAYLTKPFDIDELVAAIGSVLEMDVKELAAHREEELERARLLSRLESIFSDG